MTEKTETTAWPVYPNENPTKAEKILWLQRFEYVPGASTHRKGTRL